METLIERIIGDFHERELPPILTRDLALPQIEGKIDTVIGMRRVGKTYFLYQIMKQLLKQKIPKERLLYINFDDERLLPMAIDHLQIIPNTYYRLFPEFKSQKCYFFFDEIQNIIGWEKFVRRLLDTENIHIVLTGSSSQLLSKEIATTLRGRSITTEVFPYNFKEILEHKNPNFQLSKNPGAQTRALMENRIRAYLQTGGFPEIQELEKNYYNRILQEYVDIVIIRDVIERYQVSNIHALRALVRQILSSPANLFSVNKFYNDLRSQGISCTKNSLYDYITYLADAYLIYPVSIYSSSERIRRTKPQKIYLIDNGLMVAFSHHLQLNWGQLLENFVYMELRRRGLQIEYYETQVGTEVDFITTSMTGEKKLYQVSLKIIDEQTRTRELRALETAMEEYKLKQSFLITLEDRETIRLKSGVIEVYPVWQWTLNLE